MNFIARGRFSRLLAIAWLASVFLFGLSGCGGGSDSGASANQADIDISYATQGQATFPLGVQNGGVGPSLLQTDGKLVIAGWRQTASLPANNYGGYAPSQVYVLRLNGDGSPDTSFGEGGEVRFNVKGSDTVAHVQLQPDGKILLAVRAIEPCVIDFPNITPPCKTPSGELASLTSALVRLTPQGVLDSTFGATGIVETPASASGLALAVQNNGKILLLRSISVARARVFGWSLARYNADGAPDSTFNQGNAVSSKCATDGVSMVVQGDGRIVVGGTQGISYAEPKDNPGLCLERINADGSYDSSFRAASLWTKFDANVDLKSLVLLPNGGLLAVGNTCDSAMCRVVASRYDADGQPDNSFGVNGIVQPAINETFGLTDYVVTPVGDLVLLGIHTLSTATGSAQHYQPIWIRLDVNGQAAGAFGVNGVLYGVSDTQLPQNLLQDDKGRWLVINRSSLPDGNLGIVVTRMIGDS
jgi:uncharacterized delta-60 repeat protein